MLRTANLSHVTITVLDPYVLENISVCKVCQTSVTFDKRENTVFDERLGTVSYNETCKTCHCNLDDCTGHFGHIELSLPFFQPFFLNEVYKIVQKTCWSCFNPCDGQICPECTKKQGKWSRDGAFKDKIIHRCGRIKKEYSTTDIEKMLTLHDKKFQPEQPTAWLLTRLLPVIPPCSRPSILNKGMWCHSSLSHTYSNIVKENNVLAIFLKQNQPKHIINQQWRRCQDQIYRVYDVKNCNESTYMEGIRQRLDGKQGRARKHLVGAFLKTIFQNCF